MDGHSLAEQIMVEDVPDSPTLGVLVSGGLDSCILVGHLAATGKHVQPFYIRTGVSWEACEEASLRRYLHTLSSPRILPLVTLEVPLADLYESHWSLTRQNVPDADSPDEAVFLPGRNALLLVKAAVWCQLHGIRELLLAPLGTSPFEDASERFVATFQQALNCGAPSSLQISLPFAHLRKRQVMELGRRLPLHHTFSCIAPTANVHCGRCNKCYERRQAFIESGIPDLTAYAADLAKSQRYSVG